MTILAIDIIFTFDEKINLELIKLSNSIKNSNFYLGTENLPHLSLCKLLINSNNLNLLNKKINDFLTLNLIPDLNFVSSVDGSFESEKTSYVKIEQTNNLINFQKNLIKFISDLSIDVKVSNNMFFEDVNDLTINWIQNSISNITKNYNPILV